MDYEQEAKEYLIKRLSAEISFQNNLETIIEDYAYKLTDIAYAANVPPNLFTFEYNDTIKKNVDAIISEIRQLIVTITETLAVATHTDDKDSILDYISRDISGNNFYERLDGHIDTLKRELEGVIAASLLIGASKSDSKAGLKKYLRYPYQNPIFQEASKLNTGKAEVLKSKGLHLGIGISNSAFNSINMLGRYTISDAWMNWYYDKYDGIGAIGYNVKRGSSYPCSLCDSNVGFHTDGNLPPYHPSCCCIAIPVFENNMGGGEKEIQEF